MTSFDRLQHPALRHALARSLGMAASIFGYPMVEMLRACRLQTRSNFDNTSDDRPPIDTLHHRPAAPFDGAPEETPQEGAWLYATAWISLRDEPRLLSVSHDDAFARGTCQLSFYDAYSERIACMETETMPRNGILLVGPQATAPASLLPGYRVVCSTTQLVLLIGRQPIDANGGSRMRGVIAGLRLERSGDAVKSWRPAAVELWQGKPTDAFVEVAERDEAAAAVAPGFYANLCRALAHAPARSEDRTLIVRLRQIGLMPEAMLEWNGLDSEIREGLVEGFADAAQLVSAEAAHARSQPWLKRVPNKARGSDYLGRAIAARMGIGIGTHSPNAEMAEMTP